MADAILFKAFFQANTIKGWRYLDDAGRVMNHFADQFTDMNVGLQGLVMKNPGAVIDEARVSAQDIWIGFSRPATLQYVQDQAWRYLTDVSEIIGVTSYGRVGLRLQYLSEITDSAAAIPRYASVFVGRVLLALGDQPTSFEAGLEVAAPDDLRAKVRVSPVRRQDPAADPALPTEALMVDADISRTATMTGVEVRRKLRSAAQWGDREIRALAERLADVPIP